MEKSRRTTVELWGVAEGDAGVILGVAEGVKFKAACAGGVWAIEPLHVPLSGRAVRAVRRMLAVVNVSGLPVRATVRDPLAGNRITDF